jgi:hypothetical protein
VGVCAYTQICTNTLISLRPFAALCGLFWIAFDVHLPFLPFFLLVVSVVTSAFCEKKKNTTAAAGSLYPWMMQLRSSSSATAAAKTNREDKQSEEKLRETGTAHVSFPSLIGGSSWKEGSCACFVGVLVILRHITSSRHD